MLSPYLSSGGITSRATTAQLAYEENDPQASVQAHILKREPGHKNHALSFLSSWTVQLGKPCSYFGTLGVVSSMCFLILMDPLSIPISVSSLFSIGFLTSLSLWSGMSEYQDKRLELEVYTWERKREKWECDNYIEGEIKEMIEIYQTKGLSREDAEKVVKIISSNTELFLDVMMVEELGIMPLQRNRLKSTIFGLSASISLLVCGLIPTILYRSYAAISVGTCSFWSLLSFSSTLSVPFFSTILIVIVLAYLSSFFYGTRWWLTCCLTNLSFSLISMFISYSFTLWY